MTFYSWSATGDGNYEASFIETRPCSGCQHYKRLIDGSICRKHLMAVPPDMFVTYMERVGTCWEAKAESGAVAPSGALGPDR